MASIFVDGFDQYPSPDELTSSGEWTTVENCVTGSAVNGGSVSLVSGLTCNLGRSIQVAATSTFGRSLAKTLSAYYTRLIVGFHLKPVFSHVNHFTGISFADDSTDQVSVECNGVGNLVVRRGALGSGTALSTVSGVFTSGSTHSVEIDATFDGAAGAVTVNVDGVQQVNISGVDTDDSGNNQANRVRLCSRNNGLSGQSGTFDNHYVLDATGGAPLNAILGQPVVETTYPAGDTSTAFTFGTAYFGAPYNDGTSVAMTANRLFLRKFTPAVGGNMQSVGLVPGATSVTARFTSVVYADDGTGTAPTGTALRSGTEVTGCTLDTNLTLALSSALAVTGGTDYWIGYITDTAVNIRRSDTFLLSFYASNTYSGGVPDPAPTMTSGLGSIEMWANVTGVATNYSEVNVDPTDLAAIDQVVNSQILGDLSYVFSASATDEDLYAHNALVSTPTTIYTVCVKSLVKKSDAGARTIDIRVQSNGTKGSGSNTGISPGQSYGYAWSFFDSTPTGGTWTQALLDAADKGQQIAS
jgi:hypothetical protein